MNSTVAGFVFDERPSSRLRSLRHRRAETLRATERDIEDFAVFAKQRLSGSEAPLSIEDLLDEWRLAHPPSDDLLAIKASLRDVQNGETGRDFELFAEEFRRWTRLLAEPRPLEICHDAR